MPSHRTFRQPDQPTNGYRCSSLTPACARPGRIGPTACAWGLQPHASTRNTPRFGRCVLPAYARSGCKPFGYGTTRARYSSLNHWLTRSAAASVPGSSCRRSARKRHPATSRSTAWSSCAHCQSPGRWSNFRCGSGMVGRHSPSVSMARWPDPAEPAVAYPTPGWGRGCQRSGRGSGCTGAGASESASGVATVTPASTPGSTCAAVANTRSLRPPAVARCHA